jgi:hypothetical protein
VNVVFCAWYFVLGFANGRSAFQFTETRWPKKQSTKHKVQSSNTELLKTDY